MAYRPYLVPLRIGEAVQRKQPHQENRMKGRNHVSENRKKLRGIVMVDSRQPNTSVITTKPDQLITVTTQAGVMTQEGRRLRLGITSSPDGPH